MTLAVAAVVFGLAAMIQSVTGFGFALVSVPLLGVLVGPVPAVVATTAVVSVQMAVTTWRHRDDVDREVAPVLLGGAVLGIAPGTVVLVMGSRETLLLLIAAATLICTIVVAAKLSLPEARASLFGAGTVAGALAVSTGTSGPPLVAALAARGLGAAHFRATLGAVFLSMNVVAMLVFVVTSSFSEQAGWLALIGVPVVLVSLRLGGALAERVSAEGFRRAVLATLVVASFAAVAAAYR